MSVHPNRAAGKVRWREQGTNRARRFHTEAEAVALDQGLRGARALLEEAREARIGGRSQMEKQQLIGALRDH